MRRSLPARPAVLVALLTLLIPSRVSSEEALFRSDLYVSPASAETKGTGTFLVFHEGQGELPPEGQYFREHQPGEIAEFHLFVPDGLAPGKTYPVLIVYHGGTDGGSGKGTCASMAALSTKENPVIVLSPNMYTMDAWNEILKEGKYPVDPSRVAVFGFSSGGMGVNAAFKEFERSEGRFRPALLVCASTFTTFDLTRLHGTPYVVIAGEKEAPEFEKNPILRDRRATCRRNAVEMGKGGGESRYIEMQGEGHSCGGPKHLAVLHHLLRSLPPPAFELRPRKLSAELELAVRLARAEDWAALRAEVTRLDAIEDAKARTAWSPLRRDIMAELVRWTKAQAKSVAAIGPKSGSPAVARALNIHDRLVRVEELFRDTTDGPALTRALSDLDRAAHLRKELEARRRFREILAERDPKARGSALAELLRESRDTEYGGGRTRELLQALQEP